MRVLHSKHRGAFKNVKGKTLRVSTLGRTFLDMIRNPDHCGGIRHVVEVYRQHAPAYLRLIVDELEQHGGPIDMVRAGYLLDEQCGAKDPTVESWTHFAQRGGSRKLVPPPSTNPYGPINGAFRSTSGHREHPRKRDADIPRPPSPSPALAVAGSAC